MSDDPGRAIISIRPVGEVRSRLKEPSLRLEEGKLALRAPGGTGRGPDDGLSEITVYKEYSDCLRGLEEFSHIVVIYWSHLAGEGSRNAKLVHPAGQEDMPLVGVFATRSPARPNPLLLSTVELLGRAGNVLTVKNLDAVDGSPVVDIKPHHPAFDSPGEVRLAGWMEVLMKRLAEARGE